MLGSDQAPNLAVPDAHQQQQRNFLREVTWTTMQRLRSNSDRSTLFRPPPSENRYPIVLRIRHRGHECEL